MFTMSHRKYLPWLPQTWLEIYQCIVKNIKWFQDDRCCNPPNSGLFAWQPCHLAVRHALHLLTWKSAHIHVMWTWYDMCRNADMICVICTHFKRICGLQKQLFSLTSGLKGSASGLILYHHLISVYRIKKLPSVPRVHLILTRYT